MDLKLIYNTTTPNSGYAASQSEAIETLAKAQPLAETY
jgi:hypothetical protein